MPYHALVHFPRIDTTAIQRFRRKYDPTVDLIAPHITILFPLAEDKMDEEALAEHISSVLEKWQAFPAHLCGLVKAWDHWLFLALHEGNEEVQWLYQDLGTGILASFVRKDIEFIPHVGLGLFANGDYDLRDPRALELDEPRYAAAVCEAESLRFDYWCNVDRLDMLTLNDDFTHIEVGRSFCLK
jgi:2'-5' RNA ligase